MTQASKLAQIGSPGVSTGFKNRIINGNMAIDQRNAGASVTQNASGIFTVDRFYIYGSVTSKFTAQQNAGSVTPPVGFRNYLGTTSSSAYTVGASEVYVIAQKIEGFNVSDLMWGTANAQAVTLSFWVRSSLTGTFGGSITNSAGNRSYPYSYTISAANTWEQKSITIAGDTTGTWLTTNGSGLELYFSMGSGSTYSGTANTWAGATYYAPTGATSVVGTNGATFYITGVQLEVGTTATDFEYVDYGRQLAQCQRYFRQYASSQWIGSGYIAANNSTLAFIVIPTGSPMRATPTASSPSASSMTVPGGYAVSSIGTIYNDTSGAIGAIINLATGTAGQGAAIYTNTTTFALSAEL